MPDPEPDDDSLKQARDARDLNAELELGYRVHRNLFALHTALRVSYTHEVPADQMAIPTDEMYQVPGWVLDACYDLVTEQLQTARAVGRGRHARWLTQYRDRLVDQGRWRVVDWCLRQGITKEAAIPAAAEYLEIPEDTLEKAFERVEALRAEMAAAASSEEFAQSIDPVFRPVHSPGHSDPLAAALESVQDVPSAFDDWISAMQNLPEHTRQRFYTESDEGRRQARLISTVASAPRAKHPTTKSRI